MSTIDRIFKLAGNVGDDVVLDLRGRRLRGIADGETVTIVDFHELHEGRATGIGVPPGLWKNYSYATIRDARGGEHEIHTSDLLPLPGRDYVELPRQLVRELPDTPFWEEDVVETYEGRRGHVFLIDYPEIENPTSDYPAYRVRFPGSGADMHYHARALDLVERGNIWRYYHGADMEFSGVADEAAFYHRISQVTGIRSESTGLFSFTWDEAVQALRDGQADMIWHNWAVATSDPGYHVNCYVIEDPEVGERCRQALLEDIEAIAAPTRKHP